MNSFSGDSRAETVYVSEKKGGLHSVKCHVLSHNKNFEEYQVLLYTPCNISMNIYTHTTHEEKKLHQNSPEYYRILYGGMLDDKRSPSPAVRGMGAFPHDQHKFRYDSTPP